MRFEWDDAKARSNRAKHGISFEEATVAWADPLCGFYEDRVVDGERRWHAIGQVGAALLVVVHTYPDGEEQDRVRILGARKATKHEKRDYEENP